MGFFDLKVVCSICDQKVGLNRYGIAEKKWICPSCFKKAKLKMSSPIGTMTADTIASMIERNENNAEELEKFNPTKKIGTYVEFDDNQKKWLVLSSILGKRNKSTVYNYDEIIDFELLEDGESIASGGLGRALVGGVLFGGAGAVVGGVTGKKKSKGVCTSLKIKVTIDDFNNPAVYITFFEQKLKKDGIIYKSAIKDAQECLSTFQLICDRREKLQNNDEVTSSVADEIRKFKSLLDDRIITEEEFNKKKQELLS